MTGLPDLFPGFETRRFQTSGAEIFARIGGSGPPLLMLHGYPQTHVMWHRIAPLLADKYTLIICDLRGYGQSSVPADTPDHFSYSKRAMAEDFVEIADQLGHEKLLICSHDRGARLGYRHARDNPGRVERLMMLDIVPSHAQWHRRKPDQALKALHRSILAQPAPWPEEMIGRDVFGWMEHKLALWGGTGDLSIFAPEALAHYRSFFSEPERLHATCEDYRAGATYDLAADEADYDAGRTIQCPTAVFWGDKGIPSKTSGPLDIWREWCVEVTGHAVASGHFLAEENPKATAAAIEQFLGST
jgi:haloacetate dehalogenase